MVFLQIEINPVVFPLPELSHFISGFTVTWRSIAMVICEICLVNQKKFYL
jgi:hypothetical protein